MRNALLLGLVLVACSGPTAPDPCDDTITVSVSTLTPPRFLWSPSCGISLLVVSTVAATGLEERTVWGFSVPELDPVGPGIRYGAAPRRAQVWRAPEELEVGRTYRVTVMYTVGGDVVTAEGSKTFVWFPPD